MSSILHPRRCVIWRITACWNHPEYVVFWTATMEDLFRSYGLDGVQWGAERMGPLMNVISPWNDNPLTCFCEYCKAREEMRVDLLRTVGRAFHDATGSR